MITNPFLIAHKVRDEPAFDIAIQMTCPHCIDDPGTCIECDSLGYWWIIPTSGHRAYPYWQAELIDDGVTIGLEWTDRPLSPSSMPPSLPDHYPTRSTPTIPLADLLGLRKPKAKADPTTTPIARRF